MRSSNRFLLTPFFLGQRLAGCERLARPGWLLNDRAVVGDPQVERMSEVHGALRDLVMQAVGDGVRPVSVAGDCCTVIAVLAALQRFGIDAILLWLDAHGDFNTWETTRSGFIGGMPLAMIVGRGDQGLTRAVGLKPMAEENVVLADARDLDPAEAELLRASRVRRAYDLDAVLDLLPADRPLHVHLDVDVLDPVEAPAMLYPVAGGPTVAAARRLAGRLEGERNVASVSLTLWDLAADRDRRTERACLSVLDALVGE